jgi:hypothetical protein
MPGQHPPVTLRLEPHTIPAMRAAFDDALAELTHQLMQLRRVGVIPEPWLGDPISATVVDYYHRQVMDAPAGPYAALRTYEVELTKVRDSLRALEDHYRRTEGENAALWGRV